MRVAKRQRNRNGHPVGESQNRPRPAGIVQGGGAPADRLGFRPDRILTSLAELQ